MPLGGISADQLRCPDGNARVGGQCQWPVRNVSGVLRFGCINKKGNLPGARSIANLDGRVYNLIPRSSSGAIQTVPRVDVVDFSGGQPVYDVELHHAFYRLHGTAVMPGGSADPGSEGCRRADVTEQIGCLVRASPCSLGFERFAGDRLAPSKLLALRAPNADGGAVAATEANVRRRNDPMGTDCATAGDYDIRYPMSRNEWFNAVKGFETAGDPDYDFDNISNVRRERDLIRCACDRFYADQAATATGFITVSELGPGGCEAPGEGGVCAMTARTCP
jgi:hypothetical protein